MGGRQIEMPTGKIPSNEKLTKKIVKVLSRDDRVVFAYLYGSVVSEGKGNDIDIAVFAENQADPSDLSLDLKIDLHKKIGRPPDDFDVRIVNEIIEKGDIFALLYLRNVLEIGRLLVNKDRDIHADFLERYGLKFRECEGLINEVLA
jgi:predicted nucleotidyltransferase